MKSDAQLAREIDDARIRLNDLLREAWAGDMMTEASISRFPSSDYSFPCLQVACSVYREVVPAEVTSSSTRIRMALG